MKSVSNGQGYLWSDNRCSGGKFEEADILGCKHCQGLIDKRKWRVEGAFCHVCDSPLCSYCAGKPGCTPFEKTLERALSEAHRREQNAKALGI
jgi:hypothetical protein